MGTVTVMEIRQGWLARTDRPRLAGVGDTREAAIADLELANWRFLRALERYYERFSAARD